MMQSGSEAYQPTSDSRTQTGVKLSWAQLAFQRRVPGLRVFSEFCSSCGTPTNDFPSECCLALCSSPGLHSNSSAGEPLYWTRALPMNTMQPRLRNP